MYVLAQIIINNLHKKDILALTERAKGSGNGIAEI